LPQKVNVTTSERRGLFYGAFAVVFFSTVPVLVRWGEPVSPYGITWGRVLVGAVAVYCLATLQGNRPRFQRLVTFTPSGTWRPVWAIVALGIFPLALGHTLYNAALRRTYATYVNLFATQEVTGGIILGYLFLGEVPSFNSLLGAAITLAGIAMVLI